LAIDLPLAGSLILIVIPLRKLCLQKEEHGGRAVKWYFAYNACTEEGQFPLIRMAVVSARRRTDLEPNCIISGPPGRLLALA
jgi:hypothetical protein